MIGYQIIPCLDYIMQRDGVTESALAIASGVSKSTIQRAKKQIRLHPVTAQILLQTLTERKFTRAGRRGLNRLKRNYFV